MVPLAEWAQIVGAYAEGCIAALSELAYVVAVLIAVHSLEAADALFDLLEDDLATPSWNYEIADDLVTALHQMFFFSESLTPTDEQAATARAFLMTLYANATTTPRRAGVVCALHGVGDRSTNEFLTTLGAFPYPYEGAVC